MLQKTWVIVPVVVSAVPSIVSLPGEHLFRVKVAEIEFCEGTQNEANASKNTPQIFAGIY